jgi:hypothetical protein
MLEDPSTIEIEDVSIQSIPQVPEMMLPPGGLMMPSQELPILHEGEPMDVEMPLMTAEEEMIMKFAAELGSINPYQPPPMAPPMRHEEAKQFDLPPDIDQEFLDALPEDLRAEVIA